MAKKVSCRIARPANTYALDDEIIYEFSQPGTGFGGLISFQNVDGGVQMLVYSLDPEVSVKTRYKQTHCRHCNTRIERDREFDGWTHCAEPPADSGCWEGSRQPEPPRGRG